MSYRSRSRTLSTQRLGIERIRMDLEQKRNMWVPDDYTFICDLSGRRYPSSDMRFATGINDGLVVSVDTLEEFDEQLNIESHPDDTAVNISRPPVDQDC